MPNPYPLLYGVGFTPWDGKGDTGPLTDLLAELTPGRALDLGCGTGRHAVLMAERGWDVVGVDGVEKPLRAARERAAASGMQDRVQFVRGDVTQLADLGSEPFDLVIDLGCFHGLSERDRIACFAQVSAHTRLGSQLLMLAVEPRKGVGPHGLNEADLRRYAGQDWTLDSTHGIDAVNTRSPLRNARFRWYRMHR